MAGAPSIVPIIEQSRTGIAPQSTVRRWRAAS
jgi:hypothetical protein